MKFNPVTRSNRPVKTVISLLLTAPLLAFSNAPAATADPGVVCPAPTPGRHLTLAQVEQSSVLACDLVGEQVAVQGDLVMEVPPPGETIMAFGLGDRPGKGFSVKLAVSDTGLAEFTNLEAAVEEAHQSEAAALEGGAQCQQSEYALIGLKWGPQDLPSKWDLHRGSLPKYLERAVTRKAIRDGMRNMVHQNNSCGKKDRFAPTSEFLGQVSQLTSICSSFGNPQANNRHNIGFAPLPSGVLASTCMRSGSSGIEVDMLFTTSRQWTTKKAGCTDQIDIEAVATHEFGHWWGLHHSNGSEQTMYPSAGACENKKRSLGWGDIRGSRQVG